MSDARSLAEPSWQVVGPKRGADKAKVAREVVEWDRTTAALKQWSKEGEKAVFDRDWNTSENLRDRIAQKGAASTGGSLQRNSWSADAWITNYPSNTEKRTPFSMLQLVANQWDVRVTTVENVHNGAT